MGKKTTLSLELKFNEASVYLFIIKIIPRSYCSNSLIRGKVFCIYNISFFLFWKKMKQHFAAKFIKVCIYKILKTDFVNNANNLWMIKVYKITQLRFILYSTNIFKYSSKWSCGCYRYENVNSQHGSLTALTFCF